ncbi:MAG: dTDP-glucose 4,6-dehydratase, partial [Verrucomicrobiota bacterium]
GEETRDFIHIDDLCRAVSAVISRDAHENEWPDVFNVASGVEVEIKALAQQLCRSLGLQPEIQFEGHLPPGVPARWVADVSRLVSLGFRPSVSIEEGITAYAEWVRIHGCKLETA